jgi:hypothetical protein
MQVIALPVTPVGICLRGRVVRDDDARLKCLAREPNARFLR